VRITYDPAKREQTLADRGLDFEDAEVVFGLLVGRLVVVGYTPRGSVRHVFSMRKANDREQTRLATYFGL
jgi:uncharacterized protein